MDENYTINDDLRACGLPGDDKDDLAASMDGVGSSIALVIVDADASAGVGASTSATLSSTPFLTLSSSNGTSSCTTKRRSAVCNDFEEVFEEGPNDKKVRVFAKCIHYCHVLIGRSSHGTGHLLRHQKVCSSKVNHANFVQSRLALNPDGSIHNWRYKPDAARTKLCCLIAKLDLPLGIGETKAFEEYI